MDTGDKCDWISKQKKSNLCDITENNGYTYW